MNTTKQIEEELKDFYKRLSELRTTIDNAVDKIGGVSDSIIMHGIEDEDPILIQKAVKQLFNAADSLSFEADDCGPHLARLIKEQNDSLKGICDFCGEAFEYIEGDNVVVTNHKHCREQ